jgi:hypothetical protein
MAKPSPALFGILATLFDGLAIAFEAASKGCTWAAERCRERA